MRLGQPRRSQPRRPRITESPNEKALRAAHWNKTDIANRDRFVEAYGADLRYLHRGGGWHTWNDGRWEKDVTDRAQALAADAVKAWWADVATAASAEEREIAAAHCLRSAHKPRLQAMLSLAAGHPRIALPPNAFDQNMWLLTTANCTVDLRTGATHAHRRSDLMSKRTPTAYDPRADCPRFLELLQLIFAGDQELIDFVQRLAGYSATGSVQEQCLPFGWGGGANGKSTLLECFSMALGEYARTASPSLLMASRYESHPTEIADLMGARLVSTIEVEQERHLAEVKVKWLTGEKTLKARWMRQDFFEFTPTHTFWLLGNHKPVVTGQDAAIWRRIYLIPFTVNLREKLGPDNLVRDYSATLASELAGILAWIVRGAIDWHRDGLRPPAIVRAATESYRAEMDGVAQWLAEYCERGGPACRVPFGVLFTAYVASVGRE
ncbi:MAG: DNA primase family protein, partial [Thermoanaerobaculia bacterium]